MLSLSGGDKSKQDVVSERTFLWEINRDTTMWRILLIGDIIVLIEDYEPERDHRRLSSTANRQFFNDQVWCPSLVVCRDRDTSSSTPCIENRRFEVRTIMHQRWTTRWCNRPNQLAPWLTDSEVIDLSVLLVFIYYYFMHCHKRGICITYIIVTV